MTCLIVLYRVRHYSQYFFLFSSHLLTSHYSNCKSILLPFAIVNYSPDCTLIRCTPLSIRPPPLSFTSPGPRPLKNHTSLIVPTSLHSFLLSPSNTPFPPPLLFTRKPSCVSSRVCTLYLRWFNHQEFGSTCNFIQIFEKNSYHGLRLGVFNTKITGFWLELKDVENF